MDGEWVFTAASFVIAYAVVTGIWAAVWIVREEIRYRRSSGPDPGVSGEE